MVVKTSDQKKYVFLPGSARSTHTYVIGQPGTGKSRLLESAFMQDVNSGQGVCFIDPHSESFEHLVSRIAALAQKDEDLANRVVIFNPLDRISTVGFNPLEPIPGIDNERLARQLTDVIVELWRIDVAEAPRMLRLLAITFLALIDLKLTLLDLPRFLLDTAWRDYQLERESHPGVRSYFAFEFPRSPAAIHQWVNPVLNKIGSLLFDKDLRAIFAGPSTINFRTILDRRLVVLVNLAKGELVAGNSALLGAFLVCHIQKAALAREYGSRNNYYFLYIDEFADYARGENIHDVLSASRKYGLSLTLAHQYLDQLPTDIRAAVLNTTGTIVCFRVGYQDASILSRELFPPGYLNNTQTYLRFARIGKIPFPIPSQTIEPMNHDEVSAYLCSLRNREFVARRRGPFPPIKQRTLDMPEMALTQDLLQAREHLRVTSMNNFGKLKVVDYGQQEHGTTQSFPALKAGRAITDYEQIE